jgi:hypothetical protein
MTDKIRDIRGKVRRLAKAVQRLVHINGTPLPIKNKADAIVNKLKKD